MATHTNRHHTIAPQLEISVHRASSETPVTARLDLAQARELIGRMSLLDPGDSGVAAAMRDNDPSRLLLGLQAFYRLILERDGCVALADVEGGLWTIPARAVEAVHLRLITDVAPTAAGPDPISLRRAFAPAGNGGDLG